MHLLFHAWFSRKSVNDPTTTSFKGKRGDWSIRIKPRRVYIELLLRRPRRDLRGMDLRRVDLSNLPLGKANLGKTHLEGVHLEHVDLGEICLEGAFLSGTHLEGADLNRARLKGADLSNAYLEGANLSFAHLEEAFLSEAQLQGVNLREAHLEMAFLSEAHLEEAFLGNAYLNRAFLSQTHLEDAGLSDAHLEGADLSSAHLERADLSNAHLEGANLSNAHLEGANLSNAHLEGANLSNAHLEGTHISDADLNRIRRWDKDFPAILPPADLRGVYFDSATNLQGISLGDEEHGFVPLADIRWGNVNLAVVTWPMVKMLGDEREALQKKQLDVYRNAVRANRQVAVVLQEQGMNEETNRFSYHAQVLQRVVFRLEGKIGRWLFSLLLAMLTGYGYRMWRILIAYGVVVSLFAMAYFVLGIYYDPHLSLLQAFLSSISAFHGRVFSQEFVPGTPQIWIPAFEAVVGVVIEGIFIAMLTQRFFGK